MRDIPKQELKDAIKMAIKEIKEWKSFLTMCEKELKNIDKKKTKKTK